MTWEEILQREDIVGGELESQEDGGIYRGPIDRIWMEDGLVHISSVWIARLLPGSSSWEKWEANPFFFAPDMSSPQDIGQGRIHFDMPMMGHATIFPRDGSKLDPAKVKGLVVP